ncbi:fam-a protein, fragment [Plasmodium vinckei lentum]|uniref:Fam-a protein n=1 Tax=Plasmodium vinckei lentum TaxID=138297 RepID=A0A6V7SP08_PLAVN|nr:fam-a protein, fragment [Plasmodium vinckei lentum]
MNIGYIKIVLALLSVVGFMQNIAFASDSGSPAPTRVSKIRREFAESVEKYRKAKKAEEDKKAEEAKKTEVNIA